METQLKTFPLEKVASFYGKPIVSIKHFAGDAAPYYLEGSPDSICLTFKDFSKLVLYDDGQTCCENRYLSCDDDLSSLVNNILIKVEIKDGPITEDNDFVNEISFLEITTDKNHVKFSVHNENNGYYGGFLIKAATFSQNGKN